MLLLKRPLGNLSQQLNGCNCLVPCKRVRYEPNLSYAQLSRINVRKLIIGSNEKQQQIEVRLCVW